MLSSGELVIYNVMRGKQKVCELESKLPVLLNGGTLRDVKVVLERYIFGVYRDRLVLLGTTHSTNGKVTLDLDFSLALSSS